MEELTWIIYKILVTGLNKNGINEICRLIYNSHWRRVVISTGLLIISVMTGWIAQNFFIVQVGKDSLLIFRVIAQSLVVLVPFVGAMVIFGFSRTDREKNMIINQDPFYEENEIYKNFQSGERLARDLMLKFGVYTFFVAGVNLLLIILSNQTLTGSFSLAVQVGDVFLALYTFYLVIGISSKILDSLNTG